MRVERPLESLVQVSRGLAGRFRPPSFLGQANPMLSGNHSAPGEHLLEKLIERTLYSVAHRRVAIMISHDVDVDVAIPGVTKCRYRKAVANLQSGREFRQIDQPATRDDDILVEFCQASGTERIAEFATKRPKLFGTCFIGRSRKRVRPPLREE